MTDEKNYAGDTIERQLTFTDDAGALFNPTTIMVVFRDPSGAMIATLGIGDLTYITTGTYKMLWNIPSPCATGIWKMEVTATYAPTNLVNKEIFTFVVDS